MMVVSENVAPLEKLAHNLGMSKHPTPKEALDSAVEKAGGMSALARLLGLSGHTVIYQWGLNRVPAEYCPQLERLTGVTCESLRPDMEWDVLRQPQAAIGNPAITEGA